MSTRRGVQAPDGGPPTIAQIAAALGVSTATVSRAFSRPEMLRPDTVQRVWDEASRLGYVPNQAARALSTGKHGNIAIVVPDVANPFFPPLIRAAQLMADKNDYCLFLGDTDETPEREDVLVSKLQAQVAGLVLASSRLPAARIHHYFARRPVVLVNRDVPDVPRVLLDTARGARQAVAHLAELGHRRIAYVEGPAASWSNQQRRRAVRHACGRLGLDATILPAERATYDAGERVAATVLRTGVTAAIAFDDLVAQGLLAGLAGRGARVPDDFSVIGCDDVLAAMTYPPLTTIASRPDEAGATAVDLLLGRLAGQPAGGTRQVVTSHLVVRATTGPVRKRRRR